jgi:hypothetical protein
MRDKLCSLRYYRSAIVIFYIPETCYTRAAVYNIDEHFIEELADEAKPAHDERVEKAGNELNVESQATAVVPAKKSYFARLMPFNTTTYNQDSFIYMIIAPLKLVLNPAVIWVSTTPSI